MNLLAENQQSISSLFAEKEFEDRRFEDLAFTTGVTGAPLLSGTIGSLECRVDSKHLAGDHVIYVGRVEGTRRSDGEPLLYYRSQYRTLTKK